MGDKGYGERQDRADARSNQQDARANEQDARADRGEISLKEVLLAVTEAQEAVEGVAKSLTDTQRDLRDERRRDKVLVQVLSGVSVLALTGSILGGSAVYSACERVNQNRETIRIIIKAAGDGQTPPPERIERARRFQAVVDSRTEPINCLNPLEYLG